MRLHLNQQFSALYKGRRYRFEAIEHFNIGNGWMCRELDGLLPDTVHSSLELTEITSLPNPPQPQTPPSPRE
jgi:hypothetical protein